MKNLNLILPALISGIFFSGAPARADNPLLMSAYAADPTARVFEGKMYLYPSHDIVPPGGRRGFCMEDYHSYSSENLMDWTDHGVIVNQTNVPWVNPNYGMWAPDCVFKNGKYYFYFPANSKDTSARRQGVKRVGVAVADRPFGPFKPEPNFIPNIPPSIDPCVLIDPKDGSAYLFYAMNAIFVARLKDNMLEMATEPMLITNLPTRGLIEGPFAFERNGKYYLTIPHDVGGGEAIEYAMADNPLGPYTMKGTIMDKNPGCWTDHQSIVEYQGQWYLFYHYNDLSPRDDARRSAHADYLHFNADDTIQKVIPTKRGVGICDATRKIQIDRYSAISQEGVADSFLDPANTFAGWKVALTEKGAFVEYDRVEFGNASLKSVKVRAQSSTGGTVEIRLDKNDGPMLAKVEIPQSTDWSEISARLATIPSGLHNLVVTMPQKNNVEIDWVSFE
ncbi:MAG TPA: family 43 glycosylhydrolase [Verrucomicrobiae bacterium]|nr:family 43 glycosylhydrolase [Verrucomicrobiae bacterium]